MKTVQSAIITITAMILISVLVAVALVNEINGALLATALSLIAGLGGYTVGKAVGKK